MSGATRSLSRREFLALTAGSGLIVLFRFDPLAAQEPARLPGRPGYPTDFNAYLRIGEDGRVTCFVGKVELGQGSKTALAELAADELDVPFDSVDMVMGDTQSCPWDMGTFGSLSVRQFGPVLRGAAAEMRAVLLALAAERLDVPPERLVVKDGVVRTASGPAMSVRYAQLVAGKRIERHLENVSVKTPEQLRIVGRPAKRKDALEKVTGRALYAADQGVPGALHARIVRPPAHGATLKSVDTSAAAEVPGARVIRDGDLVAVLHERPDLADRALARIRAQWDRPAPTVDDETIFDHLVATAPSPTVVAESGNLDEGAKLAATTFEQRYLNDYVSHAAIETHAAVAKIENGKVTIWASTQAPFSVRNQVAHALGVDPGDVRVITPYVGGGFGGKTGGPQAVEAARLARAAGRPVQVVWDRAEEFFYDTFRPAAVVKIRSGIAPDGKICLWDYEVYGAGDREAKPFYDIPHQRTVSAGGWQGGNPDGLHPFAVGPWRAPSVNTNTFARESEIDIMAAKAGTDPLEFRLRHLSDPRMRRVLAAAAERIGWHPPHGADGRGMGAACATYMGTYVATMAEVTVDRASGRVRVERVACAQDMGLVVNPDGARQQTEGAITMGMGYALTEGVRFKGGEILHRNFDSYEIPRFSWLPRIDVILIDNPSTPSAGCGEPPIVCMGAVIANAIHDACGARLFRLPMTPERVKAAIGEG